MMVLTRSYKDTVVRRIQEDPEFAAALYAEALSSLVEGETATALSVLRDLIHARISFKALAEKSGIGEKSLYRMFGPHGNPTLENMSVILQHLGTELGLAPTVSVSPVKRRKQQKASKKNTSVA